uniref:Uncharacterized protein n=1 Tax=Macaca fascicularis TaxID=9541 RepID=A0A7N9CNX3_MACFA
MCYSMDMRKLDSQSYLECLTRKILQQTNSGMHVQKVQFYYIGIHMPWWFAAPINPSSTLGKSLTSL